MTQKPSLQYFDVMGRGQPLRMAMWYTKMEFDDVRVSFEDWPAVKPTTPAGSMPVLTSPWGDKLTQLVPTMRFIGHNTNLYSTDPKEMMAIDQLTDFGHECLGGLSGVAQAS